MDWAEQDFATVDYIDSGRLRTESAAPPGRGLFVEMVPRVSFAFGELHPWLQPAAPLGPEWVAFWVLVTEHELGPEWVAFWVLVTEHELGPEWVVFRVLLTEHELGPEWVAFWVLVTEHELGHDLISLCFSETERLLGLVLILGRCS